MFRRIWLVPVLLLCVAAAGIGPALIQATSIELGPAGTTDTTITRVVPGVIGIEGVVQRKRLTAGTTFYVRTDGHDTNCDGSANASDASTSTTACAFLTITGAVTFLGQFVDAGGQVVTLDIQDGTYTGSTNLAGRLVGQTSANSFIITGGSGAILTNNSSAATLSILHAGTSMRITGGISIRNSSTGHAIRVADNAYLEIGNVSFGATGGTHIEVGESANVYMFANYTVNGNATNHIRVQGNAELEMYDLTVTMTGTPAFSDAFIHNFNGGSTASSGMTYSGATTGKRWEVESGGVIELFGSDPDTYFPGNAVGDFTAGFVNNDVAPSTGGGDVVDDTSPSLGGDLDLAGFDFFDSVNSSSLLVISNSGAAGAGASLNLTYTDNGSNGMGISTRTVSTSAVPGDTIGFWSFQGNDDGNNLTTYATIGAQIVSSTNTAETGGIAVLTTVTGASAQRMAISGGVIVGSTTTDPGAGNLRVGNIELGADSDNTLARTGAGEATLEGDAVKHAGLQTMYIPASAMRNSATSSASCGDTYDSGSNDLTITVCAFDSGGTEERAEFGFQMPKAWDESTVTFAPISTCAGACAATETLQYELACASISDSDTMNSAQGTPASSSKTLQATPTNELLQGATSSAITIANTPNENDYVHCRISRDTSVDNMAGDALLIGVRFFWTDNASTLAE